MTLVILHGWGQSSEFWQEFISRFEDTKIIALDLPGFGKEPIISPNWGIPEYANWVKEKIEAVNLKDVVLLGHSFGGRIASYVASVNPNWLNELILYGAPCIYRPSKKTKLKIKTYKFLKTLGLKGKSNNQELTDADNKGLGKIFRKVVVFDQTEILKNIKVKTLLVWGENDIECPIEIGKEINNLIPSSQLIVLDNLGHNAHLENSNLFYGTIKNFIQNN